MFHIAQQFGSKVLWPVITNAPGVFQAFGTYYAGYQLNKVPYSILKNAEKFLETFPEKAETIMDQLTPVLKKHIGTLTMYSVGIGAVVTVGSFAVQAIMAYVQAYFTYIIGKPTLTTEYEFETFYTRQFQKIYTPIESALYTLFPSWKKEPAPAPLKAIFDSDTQKEIDLAKKATLAAHELDNVFFSHILLHGKPGTGKTMVGREIAKQKNMNWININGGSFAQFRGRNEELKELNALFNQIEKSNRPTVIFIDEVEGFAMKRERSDQTQLQALNILLNRTGTETKKFVLVMATNRPEDLDPALLNRVHHKIHIPTPGPNERLAILVQKITQLFGQEALQSVFCKKFLDDMNPLLEGLTGRDLTNLCQTWQITQIAQHDLGLTQELAWQALLKYLDQKKQVESIEQQALILQASGA